MPAMLRAPRLCFTKAVALEKTAGGGGDNHTGVLKRGKKKSPKLFRSQRKVLYREGPGGARLVVAKTY